MNNQPKEKKGNQKIQSSCKFTAYKTKTVNIKK